MTVRIPKFTMPPVRIQISDEEILADLNYPSRRRQAPARPRRPR